MQRKHCVIYILLLLPRLTCILKLIQFLHTFSFTKPSVGDNVPTAQRFGNDLNFYLLEQVYAMKPKLEALEAKTKEMELDLAIKKKQIEALQNREFLIEFELESDNKISIIRETIDI